ncbi:MAG: response regulator transcription factor [Bacteroidetes bacterium]|nr:response regulator transcription factor [Bacteroidota bacterium]
MNIRCLIVDDEPLAVDVLQRYVSDCQDLKLVASCSDAFAAGRILQEQQVDLIFLDITMPRLSGIGFVKSLQNPPMVIFTTAYSEYAIEGFEVDAIDFLMKPFSFERFIKAVNKVIGLLELKQRPKATASESQVDPLDHILLRSNKKVYRVPIHSILYLQSLGDYVQVYFLAEGLQKMLVVHDTLANLFRMLPSENFVRIHKSYCVALNKIEYIDGNQVYMKNQPLPVSLNYKEELMKRLASGK